MEFAANPTIVVVGLGYVGLPLAVALAEHFTTIGYDIDAGRVAELVQGHDRTGEIASERLMGSALTVTTNSELARAAHIYIVTAPTPVDAANQPDLTPLLGATATVAGLLDALMRPIIIFESTVYPGVTEDICCPLIERTSGLQHGNDFFLGYSPERINPGDREHTVERITKVVSGDSAAVTDRIAQIYERVTEGGVFKAASIKTAEAAKVIENAQRDINIAFVNEAARIFSGVGVSIWDVLEAAGTKWNFLKFGPGLVGGHCIGVDPYYLSYLAQSLGHEPRVILAGREINDGMGAWVATELHRKRGGRPGRALVMGVTFKEDVPDIRNSKVVDLVSQLASRGYDVILHDPIASAHDVRHEYGLELSTDALSHSYDLVLCAVAHQAYRLMERSAIEALVAPGGLVADLKGIWRARTLRESIDRWSL